MPKKGSQPFQITAAPDRGQGFGVLTQGAHVCGPTCAEHAPKPSAGSTSKSPRVSAPHQHKPGEHGKHCNHDSNHDHHHDDSEGFTARVKRHFNRRFKENILDTEDDHGHAVQTTFTGKNKAGAIAVAAMGLGAVIHGGMNMWRGINGFEDSLGEKHDPSMLTTTVGAGESLGGAAVILRALTGRWRG